ncbi:MAG TPA: tetratricopeptide repeat protein [Stellaceae bacterium]|nr:tetratricopeptide repeat protein [Stellaceae bacterium]
MSDIFQEVDEELRRENFAKLWARYGKYVIAFAVLLVLATAGVTQWRQYQLHQREAEGARYVAAMNLARQGKEQDAIAAFAAIARQAGGGHAALARFEDAALKARSGDIDGTVAAYTAIAADDSIDPVYRDVATLLAAQYALKSGDPKAIIAKLAPLTSADSPWRPSALELTALAEIKSGDRPAARATYQRIADDLAAPQGLRARAAEMLTALAE